MGCFEICVIKIANGIIIVILFLITQFVNCGEDAYLSLPKIGRHFRKMEFHWSRVVNIDDSHLYTPLILDSKSPNFLFFKNICENDFGDYKCVVKESEKVILTVYRALYKSRPSSCTPNLTGN